MSANSVSRQTIKRIRISPSHIDVLGIGNSLVAAGFDSEVIASAFEQHNLACRAVNGAIGATGVIEHLAITRLALRGHSVGTIIYGFFDLQMAVDSIAENAEIIGNHNMLYYQEPQLTLQYAPFDWQNRLAFQICRSTSLLRERSTIWSKVEKVRRFMGSLGMPLEEKNRFGRKADFSLLEANNSHDFSLNCQKALQAGAILSAPMRALLTEAGTHGVRVVVVEMPMPSVHRKRFYDQPIWPVLSAGTRQKIEERGGIFIDASQWISDDDLFADNLHLSALGARRFSQILSGCLDRRISGGHCG